MGARFRSRWQQIKTYPVGSVLIAFVTALVVLVILGGYLFHWDWTGFNGNIKSGKTLWDWMQLLFIPVVLAVAGFWFNHRERRAAELRAENERKAAELRTEAEREIEQQRAKVEQEIASDNQQDTTLQSYIDKVSELLLHEKLRETKEQDTDIWKIARAQTKMVLRRLDGVRRGWVIEFLYEEDLLGANKNSPLILLRNVDCSGIRLSGAFLAGLDLSDTTLKESDLSSAYLQRVLLIGTDLYKCNLKDANLFGADLREAYLYQANLNGVDLSEANLKDATGTTNEELEKQAKSLQGATMPDGSIHP